MKAVFFDLDDTLAPEMMYVRSGFRVVTEELALQGTIPLTREEMPCKLPLQPPVKNTCCMTSFSSTSTSMNCEQVPCVL